MRRISALAALVLAGLSLSLGCKEKPAPAPTMTPSEAAANADPTASVAAKTPPPASAASTGKMANCPNLVEGSATAIKDVEGGVELTVTARDAAATTDIRARARHLADMSKQEAPASRHNGSGHGGGKLGRCPVVARNTVVTADDVEGGAKLTVKPKDPAELDWLRREARERQGGLGNDGAPAPTR